MIWPVTVITKRFDFLAGSNTGFGRPAWSWHVRLHPTGFLSRKEHAHEIALSFIRLDAGIAARCRQCRAGEDDPNVYVGSVITGYSGNIYYDQSGSSYTHESVSIGPFTGSSISSGSGSILHGDLFCVDLWNGQHPGVTDYGMTLGTTSSLAATIPHGVTYDGNLVKDFNYLGYVFNTLYGAGNNSTAMASLQLAIWELIDTGPQGATSYSTTLNTDASSIRGLLTSSGSISLGGATLYGENSTQYTNGQQYTAEIFYTSGSGQNLMSWTADPTAVPEPSSMAIAALGGARDDRLRREAEASLKLASLRRDDSIVPSRPAGVGPSGALSPACPSHATQDRIAGSDPVPRFP